MKKILLLFVLAATCICGLSQRPVITVPRSSPNNTVQDPALYAIYNFGLPRYLDTVQANLAPNRGADSCGTMIYTYSSNKIWLRACSPKHWVDVSGGGDGSGTTAVDSTNGTSVKNIADLRANSYYSIAAKKKSSSDKIFINLLGYYSPSDGGEGRFYWDDTAATTDNGGTIIKPTGVTSAGRWKRLFDREVNLLWFGAKRDGSQKIDSLLKKAMVAASLSNTPGGDYGYIGRGAVYIPAGYYIADSSIRITSVVDIIGDASLEKALQTKIFFANNRTGIYINGKSGGGYCKIKNLYLVGSGTDTTAHGIWLNTRATIENVWVENFGGNGLEINTLDSAWVDANSNNIVIRNLTAFFNGLNGVFLVGGESQKMSFYDCDLTANGRCGILDAGFLGNNYWGCHTSSNGTVKQPIRKSWVKNAGILYQCIAYPYIKGVQPGVTSGWQSYFAVSVANSLTTVAPNYSADSTYFITAPYAVVQGAATSAFWGCYSEADQGGTILNGQSAAYSGDHGAGFASTNYPFLTNVEYGWKAWGTKFYMGDYDSIQTRSGFSSSAGLELTSDKSGHYGLQAKYFEASRKTIFSSANDPTAHSMDILGRNVPGTFYGLTATQQQGIEFGVGGTFYTDYNTNAFARRVISATAIPTSLSIEHAAGEFCINIGSDTTIVGWRCTVAGTPGTWRPLYSSNATNGGQTTSGTTNRITVTSGTTNPVIDIAATYVGQTSLTTLGTVTTGTLSTGAIVGGVTMTLGSDATGDVYYRNSGGVLTRLPVGSSTQVLTVSGGLPSWATPASGGMTNPMTNLGDIIYEDVTPTPTRLAGNTTTTKKFLTQTGNGTISAVPGWNTIVAGDVPTLNQNTTGSAGSVVNALSISAELISGGASSYNGSAAKSIAIQTASVTNAMLATMPTLTIKGNNTGGTAAPLDLTVAQVKTMLGLAGSNGGDVTLAGENYLSIASQVITANAVNLSNTNATGTLAAARFGALTGDVTNSAGSYGTTIANNAVTNAKAAQMAGHTFKGNNTGSTANALDLTATQLTAELNVFTSALKGLVPASGGGATLFLNADGAFTTPSGSSAGIFYVDSTLRIVNDSTAGADTVNRYGLASRWRAQHIADSLAALMVNIYNSNGTITSDRTVNGGGFNLSFTNIGQFTAIGQTGLAFSGVDFTAARGQLQAQNGGKLTRISTYPDSLFIEPYLGKLNIDSLRALHDGDDSMMVWNKRTGDVGFRPIPSGGVGSGLFPTTGTGTATADVTGDLATHNLNIINGFASIGTTSHVYALEIAESNNATGKALHVYRAGAPSANSAVWIEELDGGSFAGIKYSASTSNYVAGNSGGLFAIYPDADVSGANGFFMTSAGRVGIGTATPATSSRVDITDTAKGFLKPRMTTTQRDAISSPATGLEIYNTTTNVPNFYNGSAWTAVAGSGVTSIATTSPITGGTITTTGTIACATCVTSAASLTSNSLVIGSGSQATAVTTTGTGVLTALGINVGSAGAFVTFNGALGTPSSGTVTNLTGTASININGTVGATTPAAGTFTAAIANSFVPNLSTVPSNGLYLPAANTLGWAINSAAETQLTATALSPAADGGNSLGTMALGWQNLFANTGFVLNIENSDWVATHTAGILTVGTGDLRVTTAGTNSASVVTVGGTQTLTGKSIAIGSITGLGTGVATWLATPSSANLISALTDETGSGVAVFGTSPAITTSLTTPSTSFDLLNTTATTVNAFGAATTVNTGAAATQIWNFGGSTTASEFRFLEPSGSGTNYSAFKAVAQGANITYSLPATVGASGTVLTDAAGNGVLSWAAGGGGTTYKATNSVTLGGGSSDSIFARKASQSLTDGATVTWDLQAGVNAHVTLGGNRTLAFTNNTTAIGSTGILVVTQDGTGSRTLTLPATCKVVNGGSGALTLTTTAGAVDIISFYVFSNTLIYVSYGRNFN